MCGKSYWVLDWRIDDEKKEYFVLVIQIPGVQLLAGMVRGILREVRWTSVLSQQLGEEYVIIEEGQNGRTSVWDDPIENRMAGITYLWPCLESHSPLESGYFDVGNE